jgi:4-hydroxy-2-oxoheptanedioate aldolase
MIDNTILKRNRQGLRARVFLMTFPSTPLVELAAQAGFDAVHLDGEHGAWDVESVDVHCRVANALGMSVMARVPDCRPATINLFLDRGIQGVMAPHVETGEEARALVDACLYPPAGKRSWGGGRGTLFNDDERLTAVHGGRLGFARWANENMIVLAQVESKRGYDDLDAILAVPGLTGIAGGSFDLAGSLGHPGEPQHADVVRVEHDTIERTRRVGKRWFFDIILRIGPQELMLGAAREFCVRNVDARIA